MLNDFEQITLDRELTQDELQRYIFRLVEDLNFRIRSVESEAENVDVSAILASIPDAVNGKDGEDGATYYTWIKYSPNADGSNMTNLPEADTKYIGISYNNLSPIESTDPTDYTWSLFKGEDGQDGEDGVGISLVTITYGKSSSESTSPSSWGDSVPTLSKGDWLWVKTKTDYTDSSSKTTIQKSYVGTDGEDGTSVYVTSATKVDGVTTVTLSDGTTMTIADGEDGTNGTNGKNGYVHVAWANSADGTVDFSTTVSANKQYMGVYTDNTLADSTTPSDYNWSKIKGDKGDDGADGQDGADGADGVGIVLVTITYGKSSSESTQPTSWGSSVPSMSKGEWLWIKTVTEYSDSTSKTTFQKSYAGTDGEDGTSVYVSSATKTGGVTTVVLSDGTTMTIADGEDGTNGTNGQDGSPAYVHIAWANSADGTLDFSTTVSYGKSYMGVYTDNTLADSNDPEDYNWSKIKGETGSQGQTGATGPQGISVISIDNQYVYSDSPTTLPASPAWSTDVPTYDPTKYLWIRQVISYSNGTTTYTTPAHDAEMDDAISRLSDAENIIQQTTITIGDITVTVEGSARDIEDLTDRLTGTESAIDSISGGLTDLGTSVSGLTTTINGIEVSVDDLIARMAELREQNSELTAELTARTEQLNNIVTRFNNYVAEEGQYMRYGDQGLELGAEGSQFKTIIDNQRMAFMDGNTTTAYVSGQLFNMNNAVVRGTLKKGGYEEQVRTDGSVYTVWVGV